MGAIVAGIIVAFLMHLYYKEKEEKEYLQNEINRNKNISNTPTNNNYSDISKKSFRQSSFKDFINSYKNINSDVSIEGPLSNGDYSIYYKGKVKILIYPDLKQSSGKTVMDLIVIPQGEDFDITNTYYLEEPLTNNIAGKKFLFDISTIERSISRTACLHLAFDQEILNNNQMFIDSLLYLKNNTKKILRNYL